MLSRGEQGAARAKENTQPQVSLVAPKRSDVEPVSEEMIEFMDSPGPAMRTSRPPPPPRSTPPPVPLGAHPVPRAPAVPRMSYPPIGPRLTPGGSKLARFRNDLRWALSPIGRGAAFLQLRRMTTTALRGVAALLGGFADAIDQRFGR